MNERSSDHRPDRDPEVDAAQDGYDQAPPLPGGAPHAVKKRRGVRKRWVFLSMGSAVVSLVLAVAILGALFVMGRSVALPDWVAEEVETRINDRVEGPEITLAGVRVGLLDAQLRPTLELTGLRLKSAEPQPLMALPTVRVKVDTSELLQGRVALETLDVQNAQINLTRNPDGAFSFDFDTGLSGEGMAAGSVAEVLSLVDTLFEERFMRELEEVNVTGVTLRLDDQRLGQRFEVADGQLSLVNGANFLALSVGFDVSLDGAAPARLVLSADKAKGAGGGRLQATFSDLRVRDLAEQISTLNFLSVLDAPVEGAISTEFGPEGELVSFSGALEIGEGAVQPAPQAAALPIERARTLVRYSAATNRLHMENLSIDAPELRLRGQGHADLQDFAAGIPQTLLMQIRLSDINLDPAGLFESAVTFREGQIDARYRPQQLALDLGQLVLRDGETEIVAGGKIGVAEGGWQAAVDAKIGVIAQSDLLALWPPSVVENTRSWLTDNISSGLLKNTAAALRIEPGRAPQAAVTFNFDGAKVRYVKTLPEVENGRGYVTIAGNALTLNVHEGYVTSPEGGRLDVSGSVMQIPDIANRKPWTNIDLKARGNLQAALSLLDQKPFEFMSKSGVATDIASGQAEVKATLRLPLIKQVKVGDVSYEVGAVLSDLRSDALVEGRRLEADEMVLRAGDGQLSISGPARLDGIPITVTWQRALGPGSDDGSTVEGQVALSQRALDVFNIGLPDGAVSGQGQADFSLALAKDAPPKLELTSDLRGIGLRIEALGWAKPPASAGQLRLAATLGPVPEVTALELAGAGLSATGNVSIRPGGGLERAVFAPLRVGDRLNSRVEVIGRGPGVPAIIAIRGGVIDIRKFGVGRRDGTPRGGPPLDLALDALQVSDGIAIEDFRAQFSNERGLEGRFTGKINGGAEVAGVLQPTERGLAVRINAPDGGRVVAATGIFRNARGGDMSLVLQPTGRDGEFNGSLKIANTRVKNAPALADLLSALSVVGLMEQLSGDGILFSEVEARFTLSPGGVRLQESFAVGPSMGITMDGVYANANRRMQMQGVVSPIYLLNRPLGFLFAKKREGLFGFTYRLDGSADAPKVSVNPLSVFTPGIFREMFRRPPPKLQN